MAAPKNILDPLTSDHWRVVLRSTAPSMLPFERHQDGTSRLTGPASCGPPHCSVPPTRRHSSAKSRSARTSPPADTARSVSISGACMSSETFHERSSTRAMEYNKGLLVSTGDEVAESCGTSVASRNRSSEPCSRVADEVQTPSAHISSAATRPALPLNSTLTVFVHPMVVQTPGVAHPVTVKLTSSTAARPKKRIFPIPANVAAAVGNHAK